MIERGYHNTKKPLSLRHVIMAAVFAYPSGPAVRQEHRMAQNSQVQDKHARFRLTKDSAENGHLVAPLGDACC